MSHNFNKVELGSLFPLKSVKPKSRCDVVWFGGGGDRCHRALVKVRELPLGARPPEPCHWPFFTVTGTDFPNLGMCCQQQKGTALTEAVCREPLTQTALGSSTQGFSGPGWPVASQER